MLFPIDIQALLAKWPDLVNASFELFGGFFIFRNCFFLWRDKLVKGVSVLSTVFFTGWGFWNLYYYPSLGQWVSFLGGLLITLGNVFYVSLMIYYRRYPGGRSRSRQLTVGLVEQAQSA